MFLWMAPVGGTTLAVRLNLNLPHCQSVVVTLTNGVTTGGPIRPQAGGWGLRFLVRLPRGHSGSEAGSENIVTVLSWVNSGSNHDSLNSHCPLLGKQRE